MWREDDLYGTLRNNLKHTGFLQKRSLKNKLKTYGMLVVVLFNVLVYVANLFIPSRRDYLPNTFEALSSFIHILVKIATMSVFHDEFEKIENDRKKFWQLDCMGTEVGDDLKKFRTYFTRGFKTYVSLITLVYSTLVVKAIVFQELPFPCWIPNGEYWKYGAVYYQLLFIGYCAFVIITFDFMFTACYMDAYLQTKLLNLSFSKVETVDEIGKCKDHHNFIFGYVRNVNKIFSICIVVQYFLTIGMCCMLITIAADPSQNFATVVKCVSEVISQVLQVGFFCIGPSFLEDETDKTLLSVWHCDWYNKDTTFQKYILFVLTVSKSKISVMGGGIMKADRIAFLNVFKSILSVYTLIRASNEF